MITINQLICDFPDGGGRTLRALSVPSFTLADGGMAVITGPSGSGKTHASSLPVGAPYTDRRHCFHRRYMRHCPYAQ